MKRNIIVTFFIIICNYSFGQTGSLKLNIYDSNGDLDFFFRTIRVIGADTLNLEIDLFRTSSEYELREGNYSIEIQDSYIKELGDNKRLVAKYPPKEIIIETGKIKVYDIYPVLDTICPDTIQYLDLFDYEREFLCHGKECLDLARNRYGIYMTHYCNGVGIYSGFIYKVYFEGKIIIEIKTENNQKTYFKINSWGKAKETTLSRVYRFSDVENFLKENFTRGKLNDKVTIDGKSIE